MSTVPFASAPSTPETTFVHCRGVRLRADVTGTRNAPLVLFVHGTGGSAAEWHDLMQLLPAEHFRLAAIDLRGYGLSDKTPRGYDLSTAASDIAGVIRGLGAPRATVVGHGYGGMVGWTLAALEPERITRLVTLGSAHPTEQNRFSLLHPFAQWRLTSRVLLSQLPRLPEHVLRKNDAYFAEYLFRAGVAPGFRDTDPYRRHAAIRRDTMRGDKVAHLSTEYQRWPVRSRFRPEGTFFSRSFPPRVTCPVTSIDGRMDPNYQPKLVARSNRRAEQSTPLTLAGVGHYPHIEDPARVADILIATLEGQPAPH